MSRPPSSAAPASSAAAIAAADGANEGAEALERALLQPALAMTNAATLMPNPRSLFDLRNEYLHGVGGESLQGFTPKSSEGR